MNRELPDVQAGFRKGRGTRDQIANIRWIIEKAREFQKNMYFCFIDYAKAGNSLVVQWLELQTFTAEGVGSVPDWGTKIPQAMQCSQNKTKPQT